MTNKQIGMQGRKAAVGTPYKAILEMPVGNCNVQLCFCEGNEENKRNNVIKMLRDAYAQRVENWR